MARCVAGVAHSAHYNDHGSVSSCESRVRALCALLLVASVRQAAAQPPEETPRGGLADRVSIGGEVTATAGSNDPGFFNYATYAYDPMRNVRVVLDSAVRASRHVELLAQLRTDGLSQMRLTALYLRVRPWPARPIDIQAGRVPTTFGLFGRSGYGADNPLVGRPLAYGYLTSLRRDALPATFDDLIRMRGRGWLSNFPIGNQAPARGLPLVDTDTWDTGVQARLRHGPVEWVGAVTTGSLSSPRLRDDNGGRGLATRVTVQPHPGITLGASASRGAYLSASLEDAVATAAAVDTFAQTAGGLDVQLATGRWQMRAEIIHSSWSLPPLADQPRPDRLRALAGWVEGRARIAAGLDVAVRGERLGFSEVMTDAGRQAWEAPVSRIEAGVSATPVRRVRVKLAVQRNLRPLGGRIRHDTLLAAQAGVWF